MSETERALMREFKCISGQLPKNRKQFDLALEYLQLCRVSVDLSDYCNGTSAAVH